MSQSRESPIFRFLTDKENLSAILEVVRYAEDIREYVADRFWSRLEDAIRKHPKALSTSFSWKRDLADKPNGYFSLVARLLPASADKGQGLGYGIEATRNTSEWGFGGTRKPTRLRGFANFYR